MKKYFLECRNRWEKKGKKKERRKENKEGKKGRKKTESGSKSFKEFKGALKLHCLNTLFYWWGLWSPERLTGLPNPARISKAEIQLYNLQDQFSTHPNCHSPVANTVVSTYPVLLKSSGSQVYKKVINQWNLFS